MHKNVKSADLQGSFYPSGKDELDNMLEYLLEDTADKTEPDITSPKGVIVPHAGYVYSGSCAASAYNVLKPYAKEYDVIYLFGPAHRKYFNGLRSITEEYYSTPLGDVKIARDEINDLEREDLLQLDDDLFEGEHSIEVQLPFIYKIFGNHIKVVPVLFGDTSPKDIIPVLYKMNERGRGLFIISSDLSHFLPLSEEQQTDKETINNIEHLNSALISHEDPCGAMALNATIEYSKLEELKIKNIDFQNSAEISGDEDRVVGYASFVIY